MENLSPEEQRLLEGELSRGESLLWAGKPNPRVIFHASDLYTIPFSLLWGGFAIFWEVSVSKDGWNLGTIWGIPFVLVGQYMIWGRFIRVAWLKRRILYAVTTERVLTIVRRPGAKVISSYLGNLPDVLTSSRWNGVGTLDFGIGAPTVSKGLLHVGAPKRSGSALGLDWKTPVFVDIDDVDEVAELIKSQIRRHPFPSYHQPPPRTGHEYARKT
ncbi:hypothetical protein SAMN05421819_2214 [Bryocella elongata]|uniref:PH domain-containing protein n=1 Tax=Bryocella elongata TaxID=863522 RepID=A0A1H5YAM0_9BACT|nr:hypothetical protein [Bryocella elongata]SEG21091.1 hypothetical protein SAMN05421819_2214 [Bryocella elongata]